MELITVCEWFTPLNRILVPCHHYVASFFRPNWFLCSDLSSNEIEFQYSFFMVKNWYKMAKPISIRTLWYNLGR